MSIRIAVVTDIHHGQDAAAKKGSHALRLMGDFAAFVQHEQPDLVLDLGDRISDEDRETDLRLEREVAEAFRPVAAIAPVEHICGNHDRDFLSVEDNEAIFGQDLRNEILNIRDWRIVLFRADARIRRARGGFHCPDADIEWLEAATRGANRPTLVVSHVPLSGHGQIGNYYFENNPGYSRYPETARIREALRLAQQPVLCIAGHVHWNTVTTVDGITHLTQQSLTESFTMSPVAGKGEPCGAYGLLELGADSFRWQVRGGDAIELTMPVAQLARRWYPPLPDFAAMPDETGRQARIAAFDAAVAADA